MNGEEKNKINKTGLIALFWVLFAVLLISGSSYAWFTFNSKTNVRPMAGTIGTGGADLLISESVEGPFSLACNLPVNGSVENLQPVSTSSMKEWFSATSHNSNGISNRFIDVSEIIDEYTISGTIYLKSEGGACDVFFDTATFNLSGDPQMMASCRLGITVNNEIEGEKNLIFKLDSFVNVPVESKDTVDNNNTVISFINSDGTAEFVLDPSLDPLAYSTKINGEKAEPGQEVLLHINKDETAKVEYRIYIEGCDENSFNVVQDKDISLQLGFIGIGN